MKSKKYFLNIDDIWENNVNIKDLIKEILNDKELYNIEEIIIGCWGDCSESIQPILDMIVENKEKFQHIKSFFIGDIDWTECEISWIQQGYYEDFLYNLPNLEHLKIKGADNLFLRNIYSLGVYKEAIKHNKLKSLEIICGGLSCRVISEIIKADLPNLEKLNLYIGIEEYGFDGNIENIENLVNSLSKFKNLKYLGINNSEIQDEIVKVVLENNIIEKLEVLDFSNGTLTDKGGQLILDNIQKLKNLKFLNLHYNFLSDKMIEKLERLPFKVDLEEQNKNNQKCNNWPMVTE